MRKLGAPERFWKKVDKEGPVYLTLGKCWIWTGRLDKYGYGQFFSKVAKCRGAHRYSWILHNGSIMPGLQVCHHCDRRDCVNPKHLWSGTMKENVLHSMNKGRRSRGEQRPLSKLTDQKVKEIRRRHVKGNGAALAREFGVSETVIFLIVRGRTWKHV